MPSFFFLRRDTECPLDIPFNVRHLMSEFRRVALGPGWTSEPLGVSKNMLMVKPHPLRVDSLGLASGLGDSSANSSGDFDEHQSTRTTAVAFRKVDCVLDRETRVMMWGAGEPGRGRREREDLPLR